MRNSINNPLVQVTDVYKAFKTVKAVNGLSFQVNQGEFLALLGPNGAGKTTMVEMIEGIQHPDKGEIKIDGKNWGDHSEQINSIIGLSLQETQYMDKLTVKETLTLFASFYNAGNKRVEEVIDLVGLDEKRRSYVVNLSGGQRQRLALGIALLNRPKVLLLDEPTTGLDPNARREVWNILGHLKSESNTSMILTTHYMEEAEKLCDYIIIIDHGKILREGTLDQILKTGQDKNVVEFTVKNPSIAAGVFQKNSSSSTIMWDESLQRGRLEIEDLEKELPAFFCLLRNENLVLESLETRRLSLDDLFISLTGRHLHG
jgi:ABC-2 type transport system ATP-binding protein